MCSEESIEQARWFVDILEKYALLSDEKIWMVVKQSDEGVQLVRAASDLSTFRGWNFEKFDDLSRAVLHVIKFLKRRVLARGR